ncbi:unnamed protein product [Angiostrongylus costaricensis]|uniref:CNH domain-containing protein n=1 Tax=Angiostrongylus costaricensis TaxID=334426 RepID=A0A0R3PVI8_ANGCS|nr:unnamed protein product [Angiostrongylus costaricensis]
MFEAYSANEVAMKLPLEVTSIACQSRRGFDLDNLCKQFERKAVLDLTVCEEVEVLLCVSDGQMAAHCLKSRHYPVIAILHKVKPIHCFATWMHESWCGECRRLFEFSDNPAILEMTDRNLLGFAHGDTLVLTNFQGQKTPLADLRFSDVPLDLVYDSPYVVALLPRGQVEIRSVNPPYLIQSMVLSKASLLSSGNPGYVFVGSPFDVWLLDAHSNIRKNVSLLVAEKQFDLAIQIVELSNVFSDENKTEIKRQAALNLFHRKKFEESFQLHAEIKTDVITIIQMFPEFLPEKLQKKAAAFDLPANDKKRALLALGNYLSAVRSDLSKQLELHHREKVHNQPTSNADHLKNLHISLQVVDTALLKCYLQTRPSLVDSLLRLHNNSCFFEDAESILLAENRLPSLFILYESRKKHEMALELLKTQAQDHESDPFFHGFNQTVTYLQTLGNTHLELIFKYARWVLDKDIDSGLEIFIGEESDLARNLDRQAVFAFLRSNYVAAVIPYLEHLVYIWEETRPLFHDALAEYYIIRVKLLFQDYVHTFPDDENIIRVGDEDGELGRMRRRLIKFLQCSLYYSPQAVLLQLNNCVFYEERALLLGRLKHHEQALAIYTSILNDFESAEEYCRIYYDRNDEINSQVYLYLFRAFVKPSDPVIAGILEKDLPTPEPDILSAIRVLNRHADKIDTGKLTNLNLKNIQNMRALNTNSYALQLIPTDSLLSTLSKALHTVLQTTQDNASAFALQRSISACGIASHKERLRHVLSQRIVVGNASECCKCGKRIGNSAFVRYPTDGCLAHFGCHKDTSEKILS